MGSLRKLRRNAHEFPKALRETLGLTQAIMAKEFGVTIRTIQRYEAKQRCPGLKFIDNSFRVLWRELDALYKECPAIKQALDDNFQEYPELKLIMADGTELTAAQVFGSITERYQTESEKRKEFDYKIKNKLPVDSHAYFQCVFRHLGTLHLLYSEVRGLEKVRD